MELPVFDMAALDRGERWSALHEACVGTGFFYVADHGVPDTLVDAAVEQARRFFALPLGQRMAVSLAQSRCNRGYEAMQTQRLEPGTPPDPQPGEKGCGAHTDWGCLTLLWQDAAGGLQVRVGADWTPAPPIPGTFVVNIGDMFARWTNGRYRSTLHRVVNVSGRDRISMPFFFEGNPGHPVTALPSCVPAGEAPRYKPTTVSEHLESMYRQTYAVG